MPEPVYDAEDIVAPDQRAAGATGARQDTPMLLNTNREEGVPRVTTGPNGDLCMDLRGGGERTLRQVKTGVVLVEHDRELSRDLDVVLVVSDGRRSIRIPARVASVNRAGPGGHRLVLRLGPSPEQVAELATLSLA